MASFSNMAVTQAGSQFIASLVLKGGEQINFSYIAVGDGMLTEGQTPASMTSLINDIHHLPIQTKVAEDGQVKLTAALSTAVLTTHLLHRELGIYATHEGQDILIAYANAGDAYDYLEAPGTNAAVTKIIECSFLITGIDPAFVDLPSTDFLTNDGFYFRLNELLPQMIASYAESIGLAQSVEEANAAAGEAKTAAELANEKAEEIAEALTEYMKSVDIRTLFLQAAPPGIVAYYAARTPPTGWLTCNGAAISRTAYSKLFGAIGTTFGAGNGSTTFNVPDLISLARFIRSGTDVGAVQSDAIRNISGAFAIYGDTYAYPYINVSGAFTKSTGAGNATIMNGVSAGTNWVSQVQFNASGSVPTATENRPVNMTLLPIIKY